jgi:uncharacterized protein YndB with AHSA1/START domain
MAEWEFEHSIYTQATRMDAWEYWTDMDNHAKMESSVEKIELDGPFEAGTKGRTITKDYTQVLEIIEVVKGKRFTVMSYTPEETGSLRFTWTFEDEEGGTRMTNLIKATGPQVEEYPEEFRQMEKNIPKGMARLADKLDGLAQEKGDS